MDANAAGSSRADADIFDALFANWGADTDPLAGGAPLGAFDDLLWDPGAGAAADAQTWMQVGVCLRVWVANLLAAAAGLGRFVTCAAA